MSDGSCCHYCKRPRCICDTQRLSDYDFAEAITAEKANALVTAGRMGMSEMVSREDAARYGDNGYVGELSWWLGKCHATIVTLYDRIATLEDDNERFRTAGMEFSGALSKIDYLCGEPNEMEVSGYDLHCNPAIVVKNVEALRAEMDRLKAFANGIPGPREGIVHGGKGVMCTSCGKSLWTKTLTGHSPDCLYVRAQAALRGEEGK